MLVASETARNIADLDLLGCIVFVFSEMGVVDLHLLFLADDRGRFVWG